MATRAAIAAAERRSRESIAEKDRETKVSEGKKDRQQRDFDSNKQLAGSALKALGSMAKLFNHPEWYKKFVPQEFRANLPTFTRIGERLSPNWLARMGAGSALRQICNQVPGILVISYIPSLPNQKDGTEYWKSPINAGLAYTMSQIRKFNSRVGEYDPSDFGLYWYPAADYLYLIETARFCIKTYNTYHATNAYLARVLIEAKGFDYDDFASHIAEYKALVSKEIRKFNENIVIPKELTFFKRRLWLASVAVGDHKSKKAQIYIFRQETSGYLSADENQYVASHIFTNANSLLTYTTYEGRVHTVAKSLVDSVGVQVMVQDLRAAMKEMQFFKLEDLDGKAELEINYSDIDLEQIHNIMTLPGNIGVDTHPGVLNTYGGLSIHAMSDGYLYQGTTGTGGTVSNPGPYVSNITHPGNGDITHFYNNVMKPVYDDEAFLNFYHDDVDQDSVLEATRLRVGNMLTDSYDMYPSVRGTEVPVAFISYNLNYTTQSYTRVVFSSMNCFTYNTPTSAELETILMIVCHTISKYDWMPIIRFCLSDNPSSSTPNYNWLSTGELDNYFPISLANLELIHEAASLSEFFLEDKDFTGGNFVTR